MLLITSYLDLSPCFNGAQVKTHKYSCYFQFAQSVVLHRLLLLLLQFKVSRPALSCSGERAGANERDLSCAASNRSKASRQHDSAVSHCFWPSSITARMSQRLQWLFHQEQALPVVRILSSLTLPYCSSCPILLERLTLPGQQQ